MTQFMIPAAPAKLKEVMQKGFKPAAQATSGATEIEKTTSKKWLVGLFFIGASSFAGWKVTHSSYFVKKPEPVAQTPTQEVVREPERSPATEAFSEAPAIAPVTAKPSTAKKDTPKPETKVESKDTQTSPEMYSAYTPKRRYASGSNRSSSAYRKSSYRPTSWDRKRFKKDRSLKNLRASLKERRKGSGLRSARNSGNASRFRQAATSLQDGNFTSARAQMVLLLEIAASQGPGYSASPIFQSPILPPRRPDNAGSDVTSHTTGEALNQCQITKIALETGVPYSSGNSELCDEEDSEETFVNLPPDPSCPTESNQDEDPLPFLCSQGREFTTGVLTAFAAFQGLNEADE